MIAIEEINGVGQVLAFHLRETGIATVEDLIAADPNALVAVPGIGPARAMSLIAAARALSAERLDLFSAPAPRPAAKPEAETRPKPAAAEPEAASKPAKEPAPPQGPVDAKTSQPDGDKGRSKAPGKGKKKDGASKKNAGKKDASKKDKASGTKDARSTDKKPGKKKKKKA